MRTPRRRAPGTCRGGDPAAHDRGAAIVWALALVSVILMAGSLGGAVAQQAVVRQRTATAADMAALAAAQASGDACLAAGRTASANGVRLVACGQLGADVVVTVGHPPPPMVIRLLEWLGRESSEITATSRAGPPEP